MLNLLFIYERTETKISRLANPNICPFCGATPIKKIPYSDRIEDVGIGGKIGGGIEEGFVELAGKGKLKVKPNPDQDVYYSCNGCNTTYVWANIDINLLINHLQGNKDKIAMQINHYYAGKVTLHELLTTYRTGIVRKYSKQSWIANWKVKSLLYVCFNYENIRTFATFMRKKNSYYYYIMKRLEVPKLG